MTSFEYLKTYKRSLKQILFAFLGLCICFLITFLIGDIPSLLYMESADLNKLNAAEVHSYQEALDFEALGLNASIGLLTLSIGFLIGGIFIFLWVKYIHKKPMLSIISAHLKIRWDRLLFGVILWGILSIIFLFFEIILAPESKYVFSLDADRFFPLLIVSVVVFTIQAGFEEIFFLGYLLQHIYTGFKIPIIAITITSILFACAHAFNPEMAAFGTVKMATYYFGFAFILATISTLDNGIEIAIGVHVINNLLSALTITYDSAVLQLPALWKATDFTITWGYVILQLIGLIAVLVTYHYKFNNKAR